MQFKIDTLAELEDFFMGDNLLDPIKNRIGFSSVLSLRKTLNTRRMVLPGVL